MRFRFTSGISIRFQMLSPAEGQLALALLALPPLFISHIAIKNEPFDLHASSTLPAFVLSQNQTLRIIENQIFHSPSGAINPSFGFYFEFPSTNLLCCRASPPASRSRPEGRPRRAGALPDKSGSVVKDHPRRRRVPPPRCRVPSGSSEPSLRPARLKRVRCKLSNPGPPRQPLFRSFFKKVFPRWIRAGFRLVAAKSTRALPLPHSRSRGVDEARDKA